MQNNNYSFPITADGDFTIRTGEASPEIQAQKIHITGDIFTVKNFLELRRAQTAGFSGDASTPLPLDGLQIINAASAIVVADDDQLTITLLCDPANPVGTIISARLQISAALNWLRINGDTFSRESFIKLLRFNKMHFDNPGQHEELLRQIQSFAANTNTHLSQTGDARGNKNATFKKDVYTDILTDFILLMPIYKNDIPCRFRVSVCFDVTETAAKFWLESVELAEALIKRRDEIFAEQLKACAGLVIIHQ